MHPYVHFYFKSSSEVLMTMMEHSEEISGHFKDSHVSCDCKNLWLEQYS